MERQQHQRRRSINNIVIQRVVAFAGWFVLLTLATLVWHLVSQALPLFDSPKILKNHSWKLPDDHQILQINDVLQGRALFTRDEHCHVKFLTLQNNQDNFDVVKTLPALCQDQIKVLRHNGMSYLARLSQSGILRVEKVIQTQNRVEHQVELTFAVDTEAGLESIDDWQLALSDHHLTMLVTSAGKHHLYWVDRNQSGDIHDLPIGMAEAVIMLPNTRQFAVLKQQALQFFTLAGERVVEAELGAELIFSQVLPNDRSILLGLDNGSLTKWSVMNKQGQFIYQPVQRYPSNTEVEQILVDPKSNAALLLTKQPAIHTMNHVTGEVIAEQPLESAVKQAFWNDRHLYTYQNGHLSQWQVRATSSVNTWRSFWERIWYEGYEQPEYVWQTTYASDYQAPKYSLVPLVIGSLKAAGMALLIAIPLAISAAIYTAFFAQPKLRAWVKPSIEMLEAVPSVVIGFIAAIWLAPLAEQFLLTLTLFVVITPVILLGFALVQRQVVNVLPQPFRRHWELLFVVVFLLVWGNVLFTITPLAEPLLTQVFGTDHWRFWEHGQGNTQTLVVALALGIAIAPSIYSLAEDAIFEVPNSIKQASFALGATRFQTLRKVVLVVAYPGILSAVTLGFGRAFGETMIVLMVTGNTPVASWDPFEGLRAMTANLAIELPEAEVGSAHYQVLFLTALLLFAFTFVINSLAEWLRSRLRKNTRHV